MFRTNEEYREEVQETCDGQYWFLSKGQWDKGSKIASVGIILWWRSNLVNASAKKDQDTGKSHRDWKTIECYLEAGQMMLRMGGRGIQESEEECTGTEDGFLMGTYLWWILIGRAMESHTATTHGRKGKREQPLEEKCNKTESGRER